MEARELRLGNFVSIQEGHIEFPLTKWRFERVLNGYYEVEPIHLTEEWLVKFGFEKTGHYHWNGPVYFELAGYKDGTFVNAINCNEYHNGEPIKYVHQLQNLYFALTGKELEILTK